MHYLDRTRVVIPPCLATPPAGWTYGDIRGPQKAEIRDALLAMQEHRCAYCERRTGTDQSYDGHIEHFRDQTGNKQLSLTWNNLFWSCNDERTCGKHKDKCRYQQGPKRQYDSAILIDPSAEDPEQYLSFVSDGTVVPRVALNDALRGRAEETIRVFQLNESAFLTRSRQDAIRPYIGMVDSLLELGVDALRKFIGTQLGPVTAAPFGTAIKQFLTSVTP